MNATIEELQSAFSPLLPPPQLAPNPSWNEAPAAPPANTAEAAPAAAISPTPTKAVPSTASQARPAPLGCQTTDFKTKGCHLDITLPPEQVVAAARILDRAGFAMDTVTGVDWMAADQLEVVYDFFHPIDGLHVAFRTRVPRSHPELPTISAVFPGANWHERETHEFFGICFLGHPQLTPLLLPEDATYHPLRKDFAGVS